MSVEGDDRVAELEAERRRALALGCTVPGTPVAHVRRVTTGRSTDGVWWATGAGWSVVVKVVAEPAGELSWDHGGRELLAYRTGLLCRLPPGIRAPRCLGVVQHDDGSASLWLEGLEGPTAAVWPFPWYRATAEGVGRTQGAFVDGLPLPEHGWLNRGSLRDYVRDHPCPEGGGAVPSANLRCDERVVEWLETLPPTLSHFDLHPRNVVAGSGDVVVIDWASVGIGCVGEDVSTLIASAVLDGHVGATRLRSLFDEVTTGYTAGLRRAGLEVDAAGLARAVGALLVVRLGWAVARRLQEPVGDEADRRSHEELAAVLRELARAAQDEPIGDVVRVVSGRRGAGGW